MKYVVIDVREPDEFRSGHVTNALNITPSEIMQGPSRLDGLPKDSHIIVYCNSGNRSNVAMNILSSLGFNNVTNGVNKEQVESKYGLK